MAGKTLITEDVEKRMIQLKKKGNMTNVAIANKVTEEFGLERVPSAPTVSKIFAKNSSKTTPKSKPISKGEQLLNEAKAKPVSVQPTQNIVRTLKSQEEMLEESLNQSIDMSKFSNFGSSNLGALGSLLNNFDEGASSVDDMFSGLPSTDDVSTFEDYSRDYPQQFNESVNYRRNASQSDDVTLRNNMNYENSNYERLKTRDELYAEDSYINAKTVSKINNGNGLTTSNETRLFIEKLLDGGQIYACGLIFGGNLYFPSYNFKYMYEVQKAVNLNEGFVVIMNGAIHVVNEEFILAKMEEHIGRLLVGTSKWMKTNFKFDANTRAIPMDYSMLINELGADKNSISFVNVINTLRQNKELNHILKFPKYNDDGKLAFNLVVGITSHSVNVISFVN